MATISPDQHRIELSVSELIEGPGRRAIGLGGTGLSRMWLGQEIHRAVQEASAAEEPAYRAEVPVSRTLDIDGWQVRLSGRADGVVFSGDRAVRVDEIKSLHFAVDLHTLYFQELSETFRQQVMVYAALLSDPAEPAQARLLLVDIVTHEVRVEEIPWTAASAGAFIRQQVHRLLAIERRHVKRTERLRAAASSLSFPHTSPRPVQATIIEAVQTSLSQGRHLLLSAPTGTGKTAAVLYPALRHALENGRRVLFLTAKTLGQRIAVDTLRAMHTIPFSSMQLRSKQKMCASSEMICHEELCPYADSFGFKMTRSGLLSSLLTGAPHLDPDDIFTRATAHEVCPFEVSLEALGEMDAVVCDYNYVFDPALGLDVLLDKNALSRAILIIDEAHNLVARSREYYSPELDTRTVERALEYVRGHDGAVFDAVGEILGELEAFIRRRVTEATGITGQPEAIIDVPERDVAGFRISLDATILDYWMYKREHTLWLADDPVMDVFLELTRFHQVLRLGGDEFVFLGRSRPDGGQALKILCLDASRFLGAVISKSAGAIAMSATLRPPEFFRHMLGFPDELTNTVELPSPFPPENRLVMVIPDVDTTYRRRNANADAIAGWIARLSHPGKNALVLFPSYRFLAQVHGRFPPVPHTVLVQRPGTTVAQQAEILRALQGHRPTVVLAVLGGMFAEGVDYPGEMLSQVMVVSPGLPQFNSERELLREFYRRTYGHGFAYAYLIPGMTRVVQAAGRLIRSAEDRGTIILLGRRFLRPQYLQLLPEDWVDEDDPARLIFEDPQAALRTFFDEP
ncbi:MAG: ATP-dependent DNA helicase [Acidobacteria bacterium]|nr:ATP-dependent DNA helicase [Acidobacteriota bacterium]